MLLRITVAAALGVVALFACGPFFGIEVLPNRKQVLLAPPTVSFEAELKALVPPPKDKLPVIEPGYGDGDQENRVAVEARELTPDLLASVTEMARQSTGDAAYALGQNVPAAIRLYQAGAVSFRRNQLGKAQTYFQQILSLTPADRKGRELWARFMLGRIALEQNNQPQVVAQFEAVRALVRQGAPDFLGLAVASFGEQARGAWRQGHVANAVQLYSQQASYGSQSGANSLVAVAGLILNRNDLLDRAIVDPLARRLLFVCLNGNSGRPFFVEPSPDQNAGSKIDRIIAALEAHGLTRVIGAGLLASAAYSQGRFDLAQRLAALEDVPISAWVQAKLALRRGDRSTALKQYETALRTAQPQLDNLTAVSTELAALRVSRQDYTQALDLFYRAASGNGNPTGEWNGFADYWGDVAYLAERVLTIEELRDYLDRKSPSSHAPVNSKSDLSRLRAILARRLMRAGQRRQALGYFDDANVRLAARQYDDALNRAGSWWHLRPTKAQAWFTAATLARNSGLEILGFEREPDFAMWDGNFMPFDTSDEQNSAAKRLPPPSDPYQTDDERKRVAASKPEPDLRFQYRLIAVEHAIRSADLLPARSQPSAAVLCQATAWIIDRQPSQAERIYRRYIRHGAYVPWGRRFGRSCPAPEFAAASFGSTALRQIRHSSRHAQAHPVLAGLSGLTSLAVLAALLYYLRAALKRSRLAQP